MSTVIFRYGAMGASKTANLIMMHYNYYERGKTAIILKPSMENRDGALTIKSRIGLSAECTYIEDYLKDPKFYDMIIVDEAQFLTKDQVNDLINYAESKDIDIAFYGLKTDFRSEMFEGSKRIIELADKLEEIPTICWCGRKARFNARIKDNIVITEGNQTELGGNDLYVPLCRKHYLNRQLS